MTTHESKPEKLRVMQSDELLFRILNAIVVREDSTYLLYTEQVMKNPVPIPKQRIETINSVG